MSGGKLNQVFFKKRKKKNLATFPAANLYGYAMWLGQETPVSLLASTHLT